MFKYENGKITGKFPQPMSRLDRRALKAFNRHLEKNPGDMDKLVAAGVACKVDVSGLSEEQVIALSKTRVVSMASEEATKEAVDGAHSGVQAALMKALVEAFRLDIPQWTRAKNDIVNGLWWVALAIPPGRSVNHPNGVVYIYFTPDRQERDVIWEAENMPGLGRTQAVA